MCIYHLRFDLLVLNVDLRFGLRDNLRLGLRDNLRLGLRDNLRFVLRLLLPPPSVYTAYSAPRRKLPPERNPFALPASSADIGLRGWSQASTGLSFCVGFPSPGGCTHECRFFRIRPFYNII